MHKPIMVYGPKTLDEFYKLMETFSPESRMRQYKTHSFADTEPKDLVWEKILTIVKAHADEDEPQIHLVSKSTLESEYFHPYQDIEFMIVYDGDRLLECRTWTTDYVYDWYEIGGRWNNCLKGNKEDLRDVFDHKDISQVYDRAMGKVIEDAVADVFRKAGAALIKPEPVERENGFNTLALKDVDWTSNHCFTPEDPDLIILRLRAFEDKHKIKLQSMEQIFVENFGEEYNALPEDMRDKFLNNSNNWSVTNHLWWAQVTANEDFKDILKYGDTLYFGMTDEEIREFHAARTKTLSAFVLDGEYYDLDEWSRTPGTKEKFFAAIRKIRGLPGDTVVTVVDIHY